MKQTRNVYRALINAGWTALDTRSDPRAYADAAGRRFGALEKDGVRLSLSIDEMLADERGDVMVYSTHDSFDVIVRALIVDPDLRRTGRAGRAMGEVVRLAESANVTVYLEPALIAEKGMPLTELTRFYRRFGFEFTTGRQRVMVRVPGPSHAVMEK